MQAKSQRGKLSRYIGSGPQPPAEWWDASKKGKIVFPEWNLLAEYWAAIGEVSSLSLADRIRCHLWVGTWVIRNWYKLARDLVLATEHAILHQGAKDGETPGGPRGAAAPTTRETPALVRG